MSSLAGTDTKLKLCAKRHTTPYCSRECQQADCKQHKKTGNSDSATKASTSTSSSNSHQDNFTLIDTYRICMAHKHNLEHDDPVDGSYGGGDPKNGFRAFLTMAESRSKVLPPWWTAGKVAACEIFGAGHRDGDVWSNLHCAADQADIVAHYGNPLMPVQLHMLGETIYGRGPAGQSGVSLRRIMMQAENSGYSGSSGQLLQVVDPSAAFLC